MSSDESTANGHDPAAPEQGKQAGQGMPLGSHPDLDLDEVDVRDLLRRALDPPREVKTPDILSRVQQRIRTESRGKFFADGWSTSLAPRATYLVTSLVILVVTVVLWLLLTPSSIEVLR